MEGRIVQVIAKLAFSPMDRLEEETKVGDDAAAGNKLINGNSIAFKIYYPQQFAELRKKWKLSAQELNDELDFEETVELISSNRLKEYDEEKLYTKRERLMVVPLSSEDGSLLKELFNDYYEYVQSQKFTFLPSYLSLFKIELPSKGKSKSQYYTVLPSAIPRLNHEHLHLLALKGEEDRTGSDSPDRLFKTESELDWQHEIPFNKSDREEVMAQLESDVAFLKSKNLTDYSLLIGITKRQVTLSLHLPGMPYGPDVDGDDDRKKTLPIRHDIRNGAKPLAENLLPKPRFSDEQPEWEYYITFDHILTPFKAKGKVSKMFGGLLGGAKEAPLVDPHEYGERFLDFMNNKIFLLPFEDS